MNLKNHWMLTGVLTIVAAIILPNAIASAEDAVPTLRTVLIIDESGSMRPPLAWLAAVLKAAQASGEAEIYDARPTEYGLVLFTDHAKSISFDGRLFGSIEEVTDVLGTGSRATSGEEDGYLAIREALAMYEEPSLNGLHLLLFSDEDRDVQDSYESFDRILTDLTASKTLLEVVVRAQFVCEDGRIAVGVTADQMGYVLGDEGFEICANAQINPDRPSADNTVADYVDLAHSSGGTAWSIDPFKADGHLRIYPNRALSDAKKQQLLALAPAFGKVQRRQMLQRYPGILVARMSASPTIVAPGETVTLDGGRSRHMRSGEQIESWSWDFDDDEDAWGVAVATSFDETGDHVVVLRVMDRDGNASLARQIIHVE